MYGIRLVCSKHIAMYGITLVCRKYIAMYRIRLVCSKYTAISGTSCHGRFSGIRIKNILFYIEVLKLQTLAVSYLRWIGIYYIHIFTGYIMIKYLHILH